MFGAGQLDPTASSQLLSYQNPSLPWFSCLAARRSFVSTSCPHLRKLVASLSFPSLFSTRRIKYYQAHLYAALSPDARLTFHGAQPSGTQPPHSFFIRPAATTRQTPLPPALLSRPVSFLPANQLDCGPSSEQAGSTQRALLVRSESQQAPSLAQRRHHRPSLSDYGIPREAALFCLAGFIGRAVMLGAARLLHH